MRHPDFFDLIAEIYAIYLQKDIGGEISISEDYQIILQNRANDLIFGNPFKIYTLDTFDYTSAKRDDIIAACLNTDNILFIKAIIKKLDLIIQTESFVHDYDFNRSADDMRVFTALNNNFEKTRVYVMPMLPSVETVNIRTDQRGETKELRSHRGDAFSDPLNSELKHIQCIYIDDFLNQFSLNNIIINPKKCQERKSFRIGFTPICNLPKDEIFDFCYQPNPKTPHYNQKHLTDPLFFTDVDIKIKEEINLRCITALEKACQVDVDLMTFPEMFGTEELCGVDELEFNFLLRCVAKKHPGAMPSVTATPTYWNHNSNHLTLFSETGEKMGEQYKQFSFSLPGPKGDYLELLKGIPKEITIVHINGIGRFAFPICIDLLHDEEYIIKLISTLKVNWIICPSFSPGTRDFEEKISLYTGLGARCIWVNSCSAINGLPESPDYVGLVASPIISSNSHISRLNRKCNGNCRKKCLYVITIPLNSAGNSLHEDKLPTIDHFLY